MAFELFTKQGNKAAAEPRVTISKTGLLSVNTLCRQRFLKDAEAVHLLFDPDTGRIGIKPVAKGAEHAYTFRQGKAGGQISGSAFLKHYDIAHAKTKAYPADWDAQAEAVVISLR
ncbi:MAG: hypothetical protein K9M45_02885 [Kiritimatiellales bacterium]|nr:hypothetical protein [Kiritimatiellales bacterium]